MAAICIHRRSKGTAVHLTRDGPLKYTAGERPPCMAETSNESVGHTLPAAAERTKRSSTHLTPNRNTVLLPCVSCVGPLQDSYKGLLKVEELESNSSHVNVYVSA